MINDDRKKYIDAEFCLLEILSFLKRVSVRESKYYDFTQEKMKTATDANRDECRQHCAASSTRLHTTNSILGVVQTIVQAHEQLMTELDVGAAKKP